MMEHLRGAQCCRADRSLWMRSIYSQPNTTSNQLQGSLTVTASRVTIPGKQKTVCFSTIKEPVLVQTLGTSPCVVYFTHISAQHNLVKTILAIINSTPCAQQSTK